MTSGGVRLETHTLKFQNLDANRDISFIHSGEMGEDFFFFLTTAADYIALMS